MRADSFPARALPAAIAAFLGVSIAAGPPPAEAARYGLQLTVRGGSSGFGDACGERRRLTTVTEGAEVTAAARFARKRADRRRVALRVEVRPCGASAPTDTRRRIGRGRRLGVQLTLGSTLAPGEYALTAEARRPSSRRPLATRTHHLRVESRVVDVPVRFGVTNENRSGLACPSDGAAYQVRGRLVAARAALERPDRSVTLYLHEFGWGAFFFDFPHAGLSYVRALAEAGHASVVIDRLGYDSSDHPPGTATCLGSQADVANQIVTQLRAGTYAVGGAAPIAFGRVAVGGHSGGGAIAEIAAASFRQIDALVLLAYADQGFTNRSVQEANEQGAVCLTGGESAEPGGPGGYAYFAQSAEEWRSFMFTSAEEAVQEAAAGLRNPDPCGDTGTLTPAVLHNQAQVPSIEVPVLLLYGTADAIYEQPSAGEQQRQLFSGSDDVTLRFFDGTGHALSLERSAPELRLAVHDWLSARGF